MITTGFIRDCIMNPDKTRNIRDAIAAGTSQYGMQTFDQSIYDLYSRGLITLEEALMRASNPDEFRLRIQGVRSTADAAREEMERAISEFDRSTANVLGLRFVGAGLAAPADVSSFSTQPLCTVSPGLASFPSSNYRSVVRSSAKTKLATESQLYASALRALMRRAHSVSEMRKYLEARAENAADVKPVLARLREKSLSR